jgi:RNA polymerase sigma-70 factor (ECF subfamily)
MEDEGVVCAVMNSDWDLVLKILNGEQEMFAVLVDKYKDGIFNLAYKYTFDYPQAQDLSQEIFIHCFLHLKNFNNRAKFSTWLYRLAINKCIDWLRKNKRQPHLLELDELQNLGGDLTPEEIYINKERALWLQKVINNLPDKYREVLLLFHSQGFSYSEIGEILDLPVKTVETRIYRGKKILKEQLNTKREVAKGGLSVYES